MAASKALQEKIVSFLRHPLSYPHHPSEVEIRQTHASVLAIVPPYVYKVKKHVDLGFLDFTCLEERKSNCEREFQLNSRLCPDLYLEVLPISQKQDQLSFGADGVIVEYALKMKCLQDGCFLDQVLETNQVTTAILDAILAILKEFYEKYPPEPFVSSYGSLEVIRESIEDNITVLRQHAGDAAHAAALDAIQNYFRLFLEQSQSLFQKRVREQKIQDCHGDLHLDHVHIQQGKICIYDCVEFNDRFRYIDIASDIAFLAMDFGFHGRPDLASYVIGRMAALLQDPDMNLLADFYMCYRACVRAKVEYIRSEEREVPASERLKSQEMVSKYLRLALQYALFGSGPAVLLLCGRSGSGKSTLAHSLADLLGWKYINSDFTRKESFQLPIYQRTPSEIRQGLYTERITDQVYQVLLNNTLSQISSQRPVLVDATFGQARHRTHFVEALSRLGVPYLFVELIASDEAIKKRLKQRDKEKEVVSDARLENFDLLRHMYQEPEEVPFEHLIRVNAEADKEKLVSHVLQQLSLLNHPQSRTTTA